MKHRSLSLCILPVLLLALLVVQPASAIAGVWTATGSMATARWYHTATLLANGKVLVAGGNNNNGTLANAELYNPGTGTWTATRSMVSVRRGHTATLLPNGKVLVVGGFPNPVQPALASAELYDPATGRWTSAGSMSRGRQGHTATLLPDGKVLVVGGDFAYYAPHASAELYDPATNTWSLTGSMSIERALHSATLLPDGRVLVAGGMDWGYSHSLASAELYDPATGLWTPTGAMANRCISHTGILLSNGTVLRAGGCSTAEIYNPGTGTWSPTGAPANVSNAILLLSNGKVITSGGWGYLADSEIYDPGAGTWTATSSLETGRQRHASVLLSDGKVLAVGGHGVDGFLASAELYTSTQRLQPKSSGPQDGWVLETSETSNQGGAIDATATTFILGDAPNRRQYRSILHFNTSSLPDNAVITRAVLKIKKQSVTGTNPFTTHLKIAVGIRKGSFSQNANLQPTDFQAPASKPGVGVIANNPQPGGWYATTLNPAAYPFVNRTGITQFRLGFQRDDDNDAVADFIRFYSGNAAAANRPVLVVEYYVP